MPVKKLVPNLTPEVAIRPEVLAPAGDWDSLRAALAANADAVYLGLDEGFNARARAQNFSLDNISDLCAEVHRAGARVCVTLNTLLFETEIEAIVPIIRGIAESGVDALIIQDPAICLLAGQICPDLELHASTQMTVSSAEGCRFAQTLGVTRVVVPRELSVSEIKHVRENTDVELEVFIHGALCMSWSGQCLSSEAWGGRSANRGQCAQACRLSYDLIVDGEHRDLGDVRYLLSPADLAGLRAIPALAEMGIHTLKIEGRLKGPAYVAAATESVRAMVDAVVDGRAADKATQRRIEADLARMSLTFSRGFGDGFLGGSDHQTLVEGRFPKHRGAYLGRVESVEGNEVVVRIEDRRTYEGEGKLASPLPRFGGEEEAASGAAMAPIDVQAGMGIGFDTGAPEAEEPGGPVFDARRQGDTWVLRFGRPGPDLRRVEPGHRVWVSSDPALNREIDKRVKSGEPEGRHPLWIRVWGEDGSRLNVEARLQTGVRAHATSESVLSPARKGGLDTGLLINKLGALGGTPFRLEEMSADALGAGMHLPVKELKRIRRELVAELQPRIEQRERAVLSEADAFAVARALTGSSPAPAQRPAPVLLPLCRTPEQLEAVIEAGVPRVELDWMEMVGLGKAAKRAREAELEMTLATVRVQKPGEEGFDRRFGKLAPDGILVRHWGAMMHFLEHPDEVRPALHGDFSLNVTNSITANHLFSLGLETVTAAHDLDAVQLRALLDHVPTHRTTVVVHHHIPTFHTEHCVYAHTLSNGRDYRTCGRPCEEHRVALRDRTGLEHPVIVDVGCRNTVFNAQAQSAASLVPELLERGVARFRVEFVWETKEEALRVIGSYAALIAGEIDAAECTRRIGVHEQFGVTSGTMRTLTPSVGPTAGSHRS